jgi:hypothetical protein
VGVAAAMTPASSGMSAARRMSAARGTSAGEMWLSGLTGRSAAFVAAASGASRDVFAGSGISGITGAGFGRDRTHRRRTGG